MINIYIININYLLYKLKYKNQPIDDGFHSTRQQTVTNN